MNNVDIYELVSQAAMGDRNAMEKLLVATRPRIFAYLYRLTMDYHTAEDLLQQVQMETVKSLWRLQKPNQFWPWIYKYAWGKAQHHFRDRKKRKTVSLSDFNDENLLPVQIRPEELGIDPSRHVEYQELLEAIASAVSKLRLKYRNILTMRCYEQMSFTEIADFLECSESNARVAFFRIRRKLKNHLRNRGFKASFLLAALTLFGTATYRSAVKATAITASASENVIVSVSSMQIGFWGNLLGALTTKIGIFCSGVVTVFMTWITWVHMGTILLVFIIVFPFILLGLLSYLYSMK